MGKIAVLDLITANKIAAGEVIERPASVVKELIENSIDAEAGEIIVEITDGGLEMIKITDNGKGMDRTDAEICFQRHATSKISSQEDLSVINTLGFRGEALASIASVAEVSLKTKNEQSQTGTEIRIAGGKLLSVQEIACTTGTSMTVNKLFFNVPARKKFLKKAGMEKAYVQDVVSRYILAYPEIHFVFRANGKQLLNSFNNSLLECIGTVYGADAAQNMLEINNSGPQLKISGYISLPAYLKSNRTAQTLFVNRRYIKNQALANAVERGYRSLLPIGRHPLFVLNLSIDTRQVDVNVHPTKQEIKIAGENSVAAWVMQSILQAFEQKVIVPEIKYKPLAAVSAESLDEETTTEKLRTVETEKKALPNSIIGDLPQLSDDVSQLVWQENNTAVMETKSKINNTRQLPKKQAAQTGIQEQIFQQADKYINSTGKTEESFPELYPIGQYNLTYILAGGPKGLYLIDQHAAHERVRFEKFSKQFDAGKVQSQMLLLPVVLELTPQEKELLTQYIVEITELGFILELFGEDTFLIRAVPFDCTADVKCVFQELLDKLSEQPTIARSEFYRTVIALMSCKRAIKAKETLNSQEIESLLRQLAGCKAPYTCPHGRPTLVILTDNEIARRFLRI